MESFYDRRKRGIKAIVIALREIDDYNLTHEDGKMLVVDKLIKEVQNEFELSQKTAESWVKQAMDYNRPTHEYMLDQEAKVRGVVKPEVSEEVKKEVDDILGENGATPE